MADAKSDSVDNSTSVKTKDVADLTPEKASSKIAIESKKHRGPGAKVKVQTNKATAKATIKSETPTPSPKDTKSKTELSASQIKAGRIKVRSFSQLEAPTKPHPTRPKKQSTGTKLTPEERAQLNHEAYRQSHLSKTGQLPPEPTPKSMGMVRPVSKKPKATPAFKSLDTASVEPTFAPLGDTKKIEKAPKPKRQSKETFSRLVGLRSPLWLTILLGILLVASVIFALTRPAPEATPATTTEKPKDTVSVVYEFKNFEDSDRVYSEPNWGMRRSFKVNNVPVSDYLKITRVDASDPSTRDFVLSVDEAAYKIYGLKGQTKDYKFTTNKRVRQIIIGIVGQSAGQEGLVIVYADGTLAYQRMEEILDKGKVEPHATDLKDVVMVDVVPVHDAKDENSWATTIAVKNDGTFYDLQKYLDPEN
ncbi:MAG: hypothetical protein Q4E47_01925 [Candidatus Saccharibacteria bacterium]|nr:hypothetical protein [Candidatus Saccharibacteria bacterium]